MCYNFGIEYNYNNEEIPHDMITEISIHPYCVPDWYDLIDHILKFPNVKTIHFNNMVEYAFGTIEINDLEKLSFFIANTPAEKYYFFNDDDHMGENKTKQIYKNLAKYSDWITKEIYIIDFDETQKEKRFHVTFSKIHNNFTIKHILNPTPNAYLFGPPYEHDYYWYWDRLKNC